MEMINCPACGTEIQDTAKFCRQCGQAVNPAEATTKLFDEPVQTATPTQGINAIPTTPSYSPPSFPASYQPSYMAAATTQGLENKSRNKTVIILASLVVVLLLALAGLSAWFIFGGGSPRSGGIVVEIPDMPNVPHAPPPPPVPPVPPVDPPAPPGSGGATISKDLIYPGAEETMRVGGKDGARVLRLQTNDPINKVSDWYVQRLSATKKIVVPGGSTILKANGITVLITGDRKGTQIVLTSGGE